MKTERLQRLIGVGAIAAPLAHTLTDIAEWVTAGFSVPQLWLNYLAFLVVPFLMVGLYAVQRPKIGTLGLIGSLLYGASFIYFAHTTLFAIAEQIPDYETLWNRLGSLYTIHGGLMILGGLAFGIATYRAEQFPRWIPAVFLAGISLNLTLAIVNAPELFQTVGNALRNLGLVGMGVLLVLDSVRSQN